MLIQFLKSEWMGWIATAVFAVSYFCRKPRMLTGLQACGAGCWLVYGFAIHSAPLISSNVAVGVLALYSSLRRA